MPAPGTSGKIPLSKNTVRGALWRIAKARASAVSGRVATSTETGAVHCSRFRHSR